MVYLEVKVKQVLRVNRVNRVQLEIKAIRV
jgi:hypothetical protein